MIPAEAAHDTIASLGEIGLLQFKDLNADKNAFQRTFASQIKRCDEMARQLRFLTDQVEKAGIPTGARLGDRELEFDELESRLARLESEVTEHNANSERLQRSYNELLELQLVLERAGLFFEDARASADEARYERPSPPNSDSKFNFIAFHVCRQYSPVNGYLLVDTFQSLNTSSPTLEYCLQKKNLLVVVNFFSVLFPSTILYISYIHPLFSLSLI
jgi:hypothetical protein